MRRSLREPGHAASPARLRRAHLMVLGPIAAALAIAGCGGSSSASSSSSSSSATSTSTSAAAPAAGSGGALKLSAASSGALNYNTKSLSAKAGKVTIDFTNMAPEGHNVTVASAGGSVVGATPTFNGGTKALALTLKPGTYTFYCSVPGHEAGGMKGTLTVS